MSFVQKQKPKQKPKQNKNKKKKKGGNYSLMILLVVPINNLSESLNIKSLFILVGFNTYKKSVFTSCPPTVASCCILILKDGYSKKV
jgi:hypothetical protein